MSFIRFVLAGCYAALGIIALFAGPEAVEPRAAYLVMPVICAATAMLIVYPKKNKL